MGTYTGGLFRLDRERKQMARYATAPDNAHSLHNNAVLAIFPDREGIIWLGTQSGFSRFPGKSLPFVNYRLGAGDRARTYDTHVWSVQGDSQGFYLVRHSGGALPTG